MYLNQEMADMHLMYGLAECNSAEADVYTWIVSLTVYQKIFRRLDERLRKINSFKNQILDSDRPTNVRTVIVKNRSSIILKKITRIVLEE